MMRRKDPGKPRITCDALLQALDDFRRWHRTQDCFDRGLCLQGLLSNQIQQKLQSLVLTLQSNGGE